MSFIADLVRSAPASQGASAVGSPIGNNIKTIEKAAESTPVGSLYKKRKNSDTGFRSPLGIPEQANLARKTLLGE